MEPEGLPDREPQDRDAPASPLALACDTAARALGDAVGAFLAARTTDNATAMQQAHEAFTAARKAPC